MTLPLEDPTLERPTLPTGDIAPAGASAAPHRYRLERELGRGATGVVLLAFDEVLRRPCALKLLLADAGYGSTEHLDRFRGEARAVAGLRHPGVVGIYEIGEFDGRPYLALEFCPGGSLRDAIAKKPLPPRRAAEIVRAVAVAVQAAHDAGVIHRDLKPANILLDAGGAPKVTDFGLAKRLDEEGSTLSGVAVGTPSYMPPEQARGRRDLTATADVYSLGAVLYECLTGKPPHVGASVTETLLLVIQSEPVAPRRLNPSVPRDLETIALKALRRDPAQRYASAQQLADDLGRWLAGEPILARPVGLVERSAKWVRRNAVVSALAAVAFASMAVGLAFSVSFALLARKEADEVSKARDEAHVLAGKEAAARELAENREKEADGQRQRAERLLYAGKLDLAQSSYAEGDGNAAHRRLDECPPELRGWEHRYLRTRLDARQTFYGHDGYIDSLAWSPDGSRLVSSAFDGTTRVWDAESGRQVMRLPDHAILTTVVAYHPDGSRIFTASGSGHVPEGVGRFRVHDARTGRVTALHVFGENNSAHRAAWSRDGRRLLVADFHGAIRVFDGTGERELFRVHQPLPLRHVAWSPDGSHFLVTGDVPVVIRRAADGSVARTVATMFRSAYRAAWSPDGSRLAVHGGGVQVLDELDGKELWHLPQLAGNGNGVAWSPDGRRLAVGDGDNVALLDAKDGRRVRTFRGHAGTVAAVAFSPDGRRLASAGGDRAVKVWDAEADTEPGEIRPYEQGTPAVAVHPSGRHAVLAHRSLAVVRDLDTGGVLARLPDSAGAATVAYGPDGARVLTGGYDGTVRLRDDVASPPRLLYHLQDGHVRAAWIDADTVAVAGTDGRVRALDTRGRELWSSRPCPQPSEIRPSPDGRRILVAGGGGTVHALDARTGRILPATPLGAQTAPHVAWSADGRRFAALAWGVGVSVRDGTDGRELFRAEGQMSPTGVPAWSPDGTRLAAGATDRTVRVWQADGGLVAVLRLATPRLVMSVVWSPDGDKLVVACDDGTVVVFDARPSPLVYRVLSPTTTRVGRLAFTADGSRLFAWDRLDNLAAWRSRDGVPVPPTDPPPRPEAGPIDRLGPASHPLRATSPDGRFVAAPWEYDVCVYDARVRADRPWPFPAAEDEAEFHRNRAGATDGFARAFHLSRLLTFWPNDVRRRGMLAEAMRRHEAEVARRRAPPRMEPEP